MRGPVTDAAKDGLEQLDSRRRFTSGENHREVLDLARQDPPLTFGFGDVDDHSVTELEDATELVELDAESSMTRVVGDGAEQAGQQRRAQHGLLGGERVGQHQTVGRQPAPLQVTRGEERHRHGLGQTSAHECTSERAAVALSWGQLTGVRRYGHRLRDGRHAVVTCDLLDDVDLDRRVRAPRGHLDPQILARGGAGETDGIQQRDHLGPVQRGAQEAVHPCGSHQDPGRFGQRAAHVDGGRVQRRSGDLAQELSEPARRDLAQLRIDAPLVAE